MDKIEILEELKRKIHIKVEARDFTSKKLDEIVNESFELFSQTLEESHVNFPKIMNDVEDRKIEVLTLAKKIDSDRKEETIEQLDSTILRIEKEIEEGNVLKDQETQKKLNVIHNSSRDTANFIDVLSDNLKSIRNQVNSILENIGYEDKDIQNIHDELSQVISGIENRKSDELENYLSFDEVDEYSEILEEYEEIKEDLLDMESQQKQDTQKESFKDSLNAGISLSEQNETAKDIIEKQKEEEKNRPKIEYLRGDVIQ